MKIASFFVIRKNTSSIEERDMSNVISSSNEQGNKALNNRKLLHLLSRVEIYSLYRGTFYVWASGLCSL